MLARLRSVFDGSLGAHPVRMTIVQSVVVVVLAIAMAVILYLSWGVHWPGVGYQVAVTLIVSGILAPVFLYPSFRVASQLREANRRIREQAYSDQLTGLPNSFALNEELARLAQGEDGFAVHFVDLHRFKVVNMGLGHEAGNELLAAFARRLVAAAGQGSYVARFGGDEFIVLQHGGEQQLDAAVFADKLISASAGTYRSGRHEVRLTVNAGTAIAPEHGADPARLLRAANLALLSAKEHGVAHEIFAPGMATAAQLRRDTESGLQVALKQGALQLLYQPIVSARPGHLPSGFEALMRWRMPDGTVVMPDVFIPVAESTGMIVEMGRWALRTACADCVSWGGGVKVAVNVSPVQFRRADFAETVEAALTETGLDPHLLELEITETVLITDIALVSPILERLRGLGVRIALDDFGSGYAGLNYLRRFKIDKIKVDRSIVSDAIEEEKAANILRGVAKIAAESGLMVTVEGVDSFEKVDFILREKCADELQGFLFGRPLEASMVPLVIATREDGRDNIVSLRR